jgi:hypothetical protein
LCAHVLDERLTEPGSQVPRVWGDAVHAVRTGDARRAASKLAECVRMAGLPGGAFDDSALMAGLAATVDLASYWGSRTPRIRDSRMTWHVRPCGRSRMR